MGTHCYTTVRHTDIDIQTHIHTDRHRDIDRHTHIDTRTETDRHTDIDRLSSEDKMDQLNGNSPLHNCQTHRHRHT